MQLSSLEEATVMDWKSFAAGVFVAIALFTLTGAGKPTERWAIDTANTPGGVWKLDTDGGALFYCTVQECEKAGASQVEGSAVSK
jgi:hypothetical protein